MQKVLEPTRRVWFTQASIREKKGPSLGKIQVQHFHQRSPYAVKVRTNLKKRPKRQQRCAQSKACSKRKTQLHSTRPRSNGYSWLRQQKSRRIESLWWIPELVCTWSAKESAELDTMRTSRSPTTVMKANGEVQTREEATVSVKELDLFVTVVLLEKTPQFFFSGNSANIMGKTTIGRAVEKHISPKRAKELITMYHSMCHSLSLVYQRVPLRRPRLCI